MFWSSIRFRVCTRALPGARFGVRLPGGALATASLLAAFTLNVAAQQPAQVTSAGSQSESAPLPSAATGGITEEELKRLLVGKELFLRGGYLDNALSFDEHGAISSHSPQGSYTLCGIRINKVRLTKRRLELEGQRFGLHFLGALPYEDPTKAVDRVNITPRKKVVRITVSRILVVKPKQKKEKRGKAAPDKAVFAPPPAGQPGSGDTARTAISPAHAARALKTALSNIFADGFDRRMMAAMPGYWQLYYEAAATRTDYRPMDPSVLRQNAVDRKARLISTFEPPSNQYAQDKAVAGMSLYHVVIGADGKPGEISVARPIGFGLDESAVDSIRHARFEPAIKDGAPVPVLLDLVVEFRIYSKRTAESARQLPGPSSPSLPAPALPGPYNVQP
jgi:hypothetical protein